VDGNRTQSHIVFDSANAVENGNYIPYYITTFSAASIYCGFKSTLGITQRSAEFSMPPTRSGASARGAKYLE